MTLREYLESWDKEYLNEGIGDKIKSGIGKIEKFSKLESVIIPEDIDYSDIKGLRIEGTDCIVLIVKAFQQGDQAAHRYGGLCVKGIVRNHGKAFAYRILGNRCPFLVGPHQHGNVAVTRALHPSLTYTVEQGAFPEPIEESEEVDF